jgi:predicted nucleotidyltransferase
MATNAVIYPGSERHQKLLRSIVAQYEGDDRILSILLFGSLADGSWDSHSDLDLDFIVSETSSFNTFDEIAKLLERLEGSNSRSSLVIPNGLEEVDVVLNTLEEFSVRFHDISTTSPNIIENFIILHGDLDRNTIISAGAANRKNAITELDILVDKCIRYLLEVNIAIRRKRIWAAVELLHYCRGLLMELFTVAHGGKRSYQHFEKNASNELQGRIGRTLPRFDLESLKTALLGLIEVVCENLPELSYGKVLLVPVRHELLENIRRVSEI